MNELNLGILPGSGAHLGSFEGTYCGNEAVANIRAFVFFFGEIVTGLIWLCSCWSIESAPCRRAQRTEIAVLNGAHSVDAERAASIIATSLDATSVPALSADPKCVQSKNKKRLRYILVLYRVLLRIDSCRVDLALFMLVTRVGFMLSPTENVHSIRERGI